MGGVRGERHRAGRGLHALALPADDVRQDREPEERTAARPDLREFATFAPLLVLAVWIGLYPAPFLDRLDTSVGRVMARVNPTTRRRTRTPPTASAGRGRVAGGVAGSGPASRRERPTARVQPPCETEAHREPQEAPTLMPPFSDRRTFTILPEIVLTAGALLLLVVDLCHAAQPRRASLAWVTLGCIAARALALAPFATANVAVSRGLIAVDGFALLLQAGLPRSPRRSPS